MHWDPGPLLSQPGHQEDHYCLFRVASSDLRSPLIGCPVTRKTAQPLVVARLAPLSRQSSFYACSPSIGMVVDHGDSSHTCCCCIEVVPLWPGARVDLKEVGLYLKFRMCWTTPCLPTEGLARSRLFSLGRFAGESSPTQSWIEATIFFLWIETARSKSASATSSSDRRQLPEPKCGSGTLWPPYCKCQRRPADPWRRRGCCAGGSCGEWSLRPPPRVVQTDEDTDAPAALLLWSSLFTIGVSHCHETPAINR